MRLLWLLVFVFSLPAHAQQPPTSFRAAKAYLADLHEELGHLETLYCGCPYERTETESGGDVDREACGLEARTDETRSDRIEWEHVVPASWYGNTRACWQLKAEAYPQCGDDSGRDCCERVNHHFEIAHNDPNNLFPSSGEVNGNRSNYPYGDVEGEPRVYGSCDFEMGRNESGRVAEIADGPVRGTVARAMLYMAEVYGSTVNMPMEEVWGWHQSYPPADWEIERAERIAEDTGLRNRWILDY